MNTTILVSFFRDFPDIFLITVGILSLFVGSFLNVVIYRLPRIMQQAWGEECRIYLGLKPHTDLEKINLALPASHCPQCKKSIHPWHNIPVLSYLWLRGRCAHCHAHISIRYPLVEALTAIASVYVAWRFGVTPQTFAALLFTWIIISLTFIDLDCQLLPDELTLLLLWLGLFFSIFSLFIDSHNAIIAAMIGYLVFAGIQWMFQFFTGKMGMGQGDFKFLAALGTFVGWQMLPMLILFSSLAGILFAISHMIIKRQYKSIPLPFGPYLAVAGWVTLMWGHEIMTAYLQVF